MGWKSTITITRQQAIYNLERYVSSYEDMTNTQLEEAMCAAGFGDDVNYPYFGHNFDIVDSLTEDN